MTKWLWRTFDELTTSELYDILALRQEVFVVEQKCLYLDLDYQDQKALHLLGLNNNKLVAYLRLFPKGTVYSDAICFGRVLTRQSERGKSLAKAAMEQLFSYLSEKESTDAIVISAQLYLKDFYARYGFKQVGQPYDEDGIPHVKMTTKKD